MRQIKLLGLLAIILSLPTLGVSLAAGDDTSQTGAQGTNSGQGDQGNGQGNNQDHATGVNPNPPSGGHDDKWRTSATEIDTLGVLGASLVLASVYLIRRRNKTRL